MSSLDPEHDRFEQEIVAYFIRCGFLVGQSTYHETYSPELIRVLQTRYDPTSLYLRGRADRVSVHRTLPITYEWDAKTHSHSLYHNCVIEALPLCYHLMKSRTGVRCCYAYRDFERGYSAGFWVHQLPPIRVIKIPDRWDTWHVSYFRGVFESCMPGVPIEEKARSNGSKDPFVIIDEQHISRLPSWQYLIDESLRSETHDKAA